MLSQLTMARQESPVVTEWLTGYKESHLGSTPAEGDVDRKEQDLSLRPPKTKPEEHYYQTPQR